MSSRNAAPPAGFTLLELVTVLALMALLFAVAAVSFKDVCRTARAQAVVERLVEVDRRLRDHSRRFQKPAKLTIDLDRGEFYETQQIEGKTKTRRVPLGGQLEIERACVAGERIRSGRAVVEFDRNGCTQTYALKCKPHAGDRRWLVVAGATGQIEEEQNDERVEALFHELFAARTDFD